MSQGHFDFNHKVFYKYNEFLKFDDTIILEIVCNIQGRYPKLSAIQNKDGTFSNRPFEDMFPFLERDEFEKEMIIEII